MPFGEWLPDAPSYRNPGCEEANNCIPVTGGYGPLPSLTGQSETVTGNVRGATQFYNASGGSILVGGTDDRLFVRSGVITETTGLSSIGSGEAWDFARFNAFAVATAVNNAPQYLTDVSTDTSWSALPGSPPTAKRCARVGDFLMLGNVAGATNRIQWSAINNPTGAWASSRLTQAGQADLPPEYGEVQRIVGGRYATVFQERAIHRISYVGPPLVWRADPISEERGAIAPFSVVRLGSIAFFLAQDGWFLTNGAETPPLGSQRVNRWFFDNVSLPDIATVHGAIDWNNRAIVWAFVGKGASSYNRLLIFSLEQQRFSTATVDVGWLVGSQVDGIDLDSLDAIYGDLDSITEPLDSPLFRDGPRVLAAFVDGATSEYNVFNGAPLAATWETGEFQPSPNQSVFVSGVKPLFEATDWDMTAQVLGRDYKGDRNASRVLAAGWSGACPVTGEGEKVAVRLTKPSGPWDRAQGVQVEYEPAGLQR